MKKSYATYNQPPKIPSQFLSWALPESLIEPVLGDLSEEYLQRTSNNQLISANYWYWRQAVKSGLQFMFKTQRGFVMFIFSTLLFLGFTLMAMVLASNSPSLYMDIQSVLMIFPPAIAFTYASTSIKDVNRAFAILFGKDIGQDEKFYISSKRVFSVLGNSGVILGFFMTLIGWVAIGEHLDDITHFGSAFAVSILTLMYGIALKLLCYISEQKIQTLAES